MPVEEAENEDGHRNVRPGFVVALGPVMVIGDAISSKLKAERQVCTEIAADVGTGIVTRTDYMGTRCPARLLIEGNAHVAHD